MYDVAEYRIEYATTNGGEYKITSVLEDRTVYKGSLEQAIQYVTSELRIAGQEVEEQVEAEQEESATA